MPREKSPLTKKELERLYALEEEAVNNMLEDLDVDLAAYLPEEDVEEYRELLKKNYR